MQIRCAQIIVAITLLTGTTVSAQPGPQTSQTFTGHLGAVTMADFTPDGLTVGTSSSDHSLKLWNAITGEELATLNGNAAPVSAMAISPNGRVLASGARDNTIKLWDIPQAKPLRSFAGHQAAVTSFAFNTEATYFLSASRDRTIRVWDAEKQDDAIVLEGHIADVTAAAWRADRNQIATADAAGFIRLRRTVDNAAEGTIGAHQGEVTALFYHSNNRQIISTGSDGLAKVWQLPIIAPRAIASEEQSVDIATISADGQLIATAGSLNDRPTIVVRKVDDGSIVVSLLGHEAPVTSLAFNNNHSRLISGSEDKTVRVWDIADSKFPELLKYTGHDDAVRAVDFADTATILSTGTDGKIHQWKHAEGELVRSMEGHVGEISALGVSASTIVSASADGTIRLWNRNNAQVVRTIEHGSPVRHIAISVDNSKVASWGDNQQLKLWQTADGTLLQTVNTTEHDLTSLVFSPNSQRLAATVGDEVRVWQADDGGELQFFREHAGPTKAVGFLPDSKTLISVDASNGLRQSTVSAVRSIITHENSIIDAALYQGGNALATVSGDGVVKQWTTSNGQMSREFTAESAKLQSITATVNSQYIAAGAMDGRVFVWNSGNGTLTAEFKTPAAATSLSFSNETTLKLAVAGADQKLRFFALNDQSLLQEIAVDSQIQNIAFLPGNTRVAAAHESGVLAEWAYSSPVLTRNMTGHAGGIFNLVFTNDGTRLVSASADKTVRIWDTVTGRQIRTLSGHQGVVFGLALSADSLWIVSAGGDSTIRLWDRLSGRQLKQINAPGALYTVAMHSDGKTVAAAGIDRKVFVYDVFDGTLQATLAGHPDYIYRVAFNHRGDRLLSCGYGGHLIVWDFPSGKELYSTRAQGVLNSVAYSPDDSKIVVASDNGTAQILDLPPNAR
ncbi:MAG TPA: WD40 repeat domain-containing protein [Planctomycetes bacterium]|nr:WD40 repeat domain-containing protein [Planctomycetota bacterium]